MKFLILLSFLFLVGCHSQKEVAAPVTTDCEETALKLEETLKTTSTSEAFDLSGNKNESTGCSLE